MNDLESHDALNEHIDPLPRASGLRFYWWDDRPDDEQAATEQLAPDAFPDRTLAQEAEELARALGSQAQARAYWRDILAGGAGTNGIVELVAVVGGAIALTHNLLKVPGAAKEAWDHIARFLSRTKESDFGWDASSEVAVLFCLARVQEAWPEAYTDPTLVRVLEDGRDVGMFADRPLGLHVIVIPELKYRKTHVFVITEKLVVESHVVINKLTRDAENRG